MALKQSHVAIIYSLMLYLCNVHAISLEQCQALLNYNMYTCTLQCMQLSVSSLYTQVWDALNPRPKHYCWQLNKAYLHAVELNFPESGVSINSFLNYCYVKVYLYTSVQIHFYIFVIHQHSYYKQIYRNQSVIYNTCSSIILSGVYEEEYATPTHILFYIPD